MSYHKFDTRMKTVYLYAVRSLQFLHNYIYFECLLVARVLKMYNEEQDN